MSQLRFITNRDADRRGRILVVEKGLQCVASLELIVNAAPEQVQVVDDVFEAIAIAGLASGEDQVDTVVVPVTIPDYSPTRLVQAFHHCDARIRLVLLVPTGRMDAGQEALDSGFHGALELPILSTDLVTQALGIDPVVGAASVPEPGTPTTAPPERAPAPRPTARREADDRGTEDVETGDLGDVHLIDCIMANDGSFRSTSLAMIREALGTNDVHLVLPEELLEKRNRTLIDIMQGEDYLGVLASNSLSPDELRPWAEWLTSWMGLEHHLRGLSRLAETDELTGAGNRRAFDRIIAETLEVARKERRLVTVMVFDIDNFKSYNDRFGHEAGDHVLRSTVELLRSVIRRGDHVCRIGGDEFVVIFSDFDEPRAENSKPLESVEDIAHRFHAKICDLRLTQVGVDGEHAISISAGLATFPWEGSNGPALLRRADALALESKRSGKNMIRFGSIADGAESGDRPDDPSSSSDPPADP